MLLDKPAGPTSHDMVAIVRRRLRIKAVGHTGTLDPFATGLLVMLVGSATRLARFLGSLDKTYLATARLGWATDTDDATGSPIGSIHEGPWPDRQAVETELRRFVGGYSQVPPSYSAKKVAGIRSYRLARQGVVAALEATDVDVHESRLVDYEPPFVTWRVVVSAGTYIRALARDLGARLGFGAHLTALRRERVGQFSVDDSVSPDEVTIERLLPPERLIEHLARQAVSSDEAVGLRHGRRVAAVIDDPGPAALTADGKLIAVGERVGDQWQPVLVLPAA